MSKEISVNGVELDYIVRGSGPPLYFLHGGMESRESFVHQIPVFAEHFSVVALDSREQGRSGGSAEQITYELMASDVLALADQLGHRHFSVMGSSDGGITALTIAMQHPERINNLVLLGANFNVSAYPAETLAFLRSYQWDGNRDPGTFPGNMIEHYLLGHDSLDGFGDLLREMIAMWTTSPNYAVNDLQAIEAPTLVINGDRNDTALEHAIELYRGLPNAQLFIVPNGSHYSLQQQPEVINGAALPFLLQSRAQ